MCSRIVFYSKSADKFPGKGTNEFLSDCDKNNDVFKELNSVKDWRRMLSNFYESEFKHDAMTFNTAEHAFHYNKFKLFDKDVAFKFALESDSDISKGDGKAAQKARKLLMLNEEQLTKWFKVREKSLNKILYDKFNQSDELKSMLVKTKTAELWHFLGRGHKKGENLERWEYLEKLRIDFSY